MNVDFEKLLKNSIANFRIKEQKQEIISNPSNKLDKALINLDLQLCELIDCSKRCSLEVVNNLDVDNYKKNLNKKFVECLDAYFLLANLKNWNDLIIDGSEELNKIIKLNPDKEISKTYLIMKKTLYNAFFNHSKQDFNRSWKVFLKLCFVDLNLTLN
ncbi:hypothetical protein [Apilactobacillus xinyiensis]|uniref:hypothetical protein n=1 Tax=Apilactobacillus xinyiensis TaxID=2841032 RepID=UPI003364D6E2